MDHNGKLVIGKAHLKLLKAKNLSKKNRRIMNNTMMRPVKLTDNEHPNEA